MQEVVFKVRPSSGGTPYTVVVTKDGQNVTIVCDCAAGAYGDPCRHRTEIITGKATSLIDPDRNALSKVVEWFEGTDARRYLSLIEETARRQEALKKQMKALRTAYGRALEHGSRARELYRMPDFIDQARNA